MGKNIPKERKEGMYKAILELKSLEECFDFFEDICAMTAQHCFTAFLL